MFQHILAPMDGSTLAECVLPHAMTLAHAFGARVTFLRVLERENIIDDSPPIDPLAWQIKRAEAQAYLDALSGRFRESGLQSDGILMEGQAAERVLEFSGKEKVDLIILSSHGKSGLTGWNVNSVVMKIILRSRLSTLIVRAYQPRNGDLGGARYQKIIVPLDGSQRAECVLPAVARLADHQAAQVQIVHMVRRPEMPRLEPIAPEDVDLAERVTECNRREAERYLNQLRSRVSKEFSPRLLIGDDHIGAIHDLVEEESADLVVLSAHGCSQSSKRAYGSLTTSFIVYGTEPLLIVQDLPVGRLKPTRAEIAAQEHRGH